MIAIPPVAILTKHVNIMFSKTIDIQRRFTYIVLNSLAKQAAVNSKRAPVYHNWDM